VYSVNVACLNLIQLVYRNQCSCPFAGKYLAVVLYCEIWSPSWCNYNYLGYV